MYYLPVGQANLHDCIVLKVTFKDPHVGFHALSFCSIFSKLRLASSQLMKSSEKDTNERSRISPEVPGVVLSESNLSPPTFALFLKLIIEMSLQMKINGLK